MCCKNINYEIQILFLIVIGAQMLFQFEYMVLAAIDIFFFSFQDDLIKTYILSMACNMWIAVRLFVVMSIFTLVVAVVSVLVFNDSGE